MTIEQLASMANGFAAQHHLVPVVVFGLLIQKTVRPALVDFRQFLVTILALGLALGAKFGITGVEIEAQRPQAERIIPNVPEAPNVEAVMGALSRPAP